MQNLALLTPYVGLPSETFIQRHLTDLAPGHTVVVSTDLTKAAPERTWAVTEPNLVMRGRPRITQMGWRRRAIGRIVLGRPSGAFGWRPTEVSLAELTAFLREHEVRHALAEYLDIWLPVVPHLLKAGVEVIGHGHGYDVSTRLRQAWWQQAYRGWNAAEAVVVVSNVARDRLIARGLDVAKIHVIPCGVEVPAQPPSRLVHDGVRFLAVGRFVEKKGPLTTITAFARAQVATEHNCTLTMVGEGPQLEQARALAEQLSIGGAVTFVGAAHHREVLQLMQDSDVFVQHSQVDPATGDEEGLPVAILEAMAAGLPIVSTHHAGIPEAVIDGATGLLVPEGDVAGMAYAIRTITEQPAFREALGHAGWARASAEYSWQTERDKLRQLLRWTP